MLDAALQYAGRGWRVFPCHTITENGSCTCGKASCTDQGKHPHIKNWPGQATTDRKTIERWWTRWPDANIGLATGNGLLVVDIDSPAGYAELRELALVNGGMPEAPAVATGRGAHLYFRGDLDGSRSVGSLLFRGANGYVIAPPSKHKSGKVYTWIRGVSLSAAPTWLLNHANSQPQTAGKTRQSIPPLPDYLKKSQELHYVNGHPSLSVTAKALQALAPQWNQEEEARIRSALAAVPASCRREPWLKIGMALHSLEWVGSDGSDRGFELWREWSATCPDKFSDHDVETRWRSFGRREGVTIASLFHVAQEHGWSGAMLVNESDLLKTPPDNSRQLPTETFRDNQQHPPLGDAAAVGPDSFFGVESGTNRTADDPIALINARHAVISDLGGKCVVLGWTPSKLDPVILLPSFQSFTTFGERYSNVYVTVPEGDKQVRKAIGRWWLAHPRRRTYAGIDLEPGGDEILSGNRLNLWRGFGVEPRRGSWERTKGHLREVIAGGNRAHLDYIVRWCAWAVQHPGERAGVALVLRGGEGVGKGTFAHALLRIFAGHSLHIHQSRHLVGHFNAILQNCCLLYADEAFWAGDKQGESQLKGLLSDAEMVIEHKGINPFTVKNCLHVVMAANQDWVVPAAHDARRYAVFDVSDSRRDDHAYFAAIYDEIDGDGAAAMLYDLLHLDLGTWHPKHLVETKALREQKERSMSPIEQWYETILQDGFLPSSSKDAPDKTFNQYLLAMARETPRGRDISDQAFGRFLSNMGCVPIRNAKHRGWQFLPLPEARAKWERRYRGWSWKHESEQWEVRV